jgi:hypothetical protein
MLFRKSQRPLKLCIDKEAWDEVRDMLKTTKGQEKVKYKAYTDPISGNEITFLHLACRKRAPLDVIMAICTLRQSLILTPSETGGDLPLHYAAASGSLPTVSYLIKQYPQGVAARCGHDGAFGNTVTPLHVAVMNKAPPNIIQELVLHGPPGTNILRNDEGKTPYDLALQTYHDSREERAIVLELLIPKTRIAAPWVTVACLSATGYFWWKAVLTWSSTCQHILSSIRWELFSIFVPTLVGILAYLWWIQRPSRQLPATFIFTEDLEKKCRVVNVLPHRIERQNSDASTDCTTVLSSNGWDSW